MGQYHVLVNLDKHEAVWPHGVGDGLKLLEWSDGGMLTVMQLLLSCAIKGGARGGGDYDSANPLIGSWAGDRIAVVGDYAEDGDLPAEFGASSIYARAHGTLKQQLAELRYGRWPLDAAGLRQETAKLRAEDKEYRKQGLSYFTDITDQVRALLMEFGHEFSGEGWMRRTSPYVTGERRLVPDVVIG
jgi:hypothetical protein